MNEFVSGYIKKCFLLKDQLIISILKMATGKTLDNLTGEDAEKMTITYVSGYEEKQKVYYDGKHIGDIYCEIKELQVLFTFTPVPQQEMRNG